MNNISYRSSAHRSSKALALVIAVSLVVSGCSWLPSWMGGEKKQQEKLPGERIAVLPAGSELQPDEAVKAVPFSLPPAGANADWPQHSAGLPASAGNVAGSGFDTISEERAGDGEEFQTTLLPRPVVANGTVFAMDGVGNVSAHDAADIGKVRWRVAGVSEDGAPQIMGGGLAFDQGRLYATSGRGAIAAMDAATGKPLWHKNLLIPFLSAPTVSGDKLFAVTVDNQLYALNATTGEVLWTHRGISETAQLMNPVSPTVAGEEVIVPYSSGEVYALATADGKELWSDSLAGAQSLKSAGFFTGIGGDPVIDGSVVFTVSSGNAISVMALGTGQRAWARPIGAINTPWLAGDYIFLLTNDNTLLCMVKYTGQVRWAAKLPVFEDEKEKRHPIVWKGPVLADGKLVLVSASARMLLISAEDGKTISEKPLPEKIYTAPVIAGGKMYLLGQDATLYSLQ